MSVAVTPAGAPEVLRLTVWAVPEVTAVETVAVVEEPGWTNVPWLSIASLRLRVESAPAAALPAPVGHELRGLRDRLAAYAPRAARRPAEPAGS
ncbi:hypothetical protein ABZW30_02120 [Kitasatospora sp. NPDC004669]|uniref:hypothetical protein n=1 Tax=Kitasatospora sp. NPDC004669 TaxID=3154555 RepID=UPI0033A559E3